MSDECIKHDAIMIVLNMRNIIFSLLRDTTIHMNEYKDEREWQIANSRRWFLLREERGITEEKLRSCWWFSPYGFMQGAWVSIVLPLCL